MWLETVSISHKSIHSAETPHLLIQRQISFCVHSQRPMRVHLKSKSLLYVPALWKCITKYQLCGQILSENNQVTFIHNLLSSKALVLRATIAVLSVKTWLPLELRQVLSYELPPVFVHFPLKEKGPLGALLSAPVGASKRETPTSNFTESTVI